MTNYTLTDIYEMYQKEFGLKRELFGTLYKIYGGKKRIDSYSKEMYYYLSAMIFLKYANNNLSKNESIDYYKVYYLNPCIDLFWRQYHNQFNFDWDLVRTDTGVICFITGTQFNLHTTVNLEESYAISECQRVVGKIFVELYWHRFSRIVSLDAMDEIRGIVWNIINNTKLVPAV